MARPGITYSDVVNAAQQLLGQGVHPTIEAIRQLTRTGSHGTLAAHLRRWKETQQHTQKIAAKENLPEELVSLTKGLWERVVTQSAEQFAPLEENYQREITELKEALEKYKNNNQRWQTLFNQWQQEKSQLANEKMTLEQALEFSQREIASINIKQEALLQQLHEKQERITELNRLQHQSQANLDHYRESAREQRLMEQERYQQQQQQLEQTIHQLQQKLTAFSEEKTRLQQQYNTIIGENDTVKQKCQALKNQVTQLQETLSSVEKERNEKREATNYWQGEYHTSQQKINEQALAFLDQQKHLAVQAEQLVSAQKQLHEWKDQAKSLALEKWHLAEEKARWEGQVKQLEKMLKVRAESLSG